MKRRILIEKYPSIWESKPLDEAEFSRYFTMYTEVLKGQRTALILPMDGGDAAFPSAFLEQCVFVQMKIEDVEQGNDN